MVQFETADGSVTLNADQAADIANAVVVHACFASKAAAAAGIVAGSFTSIADIDATAWPRVGSNAGRYKATANRSSPFPYFGQLQAIGVTTRGRLIASRRPCLNLHEFMSYVDNHRLVCGSILVRSRH